MAVLIRQAVKLRQYGVYHLFDCWYQPGNINIFSSGLVKTISTSCHACQENSTSAKPSATKPASDPDFKNIYTFRYIVHTRVLSRFKIYQTLLTIGAIPAGIVMHSADALSTPGLVSFYGIASVATVMLYVMSTFFRRIVGIISINHHADVVRISHLTFWGRRKNEDFLVSDIVPLSDMSVKPDDIYQVVQFYEKRKKFFWFHRHGKNTDAEAIQKVFGKF